jgi:hypothetical protein
MKVLSYKQYQMAEDLANFIANPIINESDNKDTEINSIIKRLSQDLRFNYGLVFTFGVGVRAMYPIVDGLIKNGVLKVEPTMENIVLVSIAAITITYLEESKNKIAPSEIPCDCKGKSKDCKFCGGIGMVKIDLSKKDARNFLEELKLRTGLKKTQDGIINKLSECFKFLGTILKDLFKNTPYIVNGLIDMLGYTSILIPAMNGISAIIGEYELTMDTLIGNSAAIALGIATFLSKYGFDWLIKKFKNKFGLNTKRLDIPTAVRPYDIIDSDTDEETLDGNKLIKEQ